MRKSAQLLDIGFIRGCGDKYSRERSLSFIVLSISTLGS